MELELTYQNKLTYRKQSIYFYQTFSSTGQFPFELHLFLLPSVAFLKKITVILSITFIYFRSALFCFPFVLSLFYVSLCLGFTIITFKQILKCPMQCFSFIYFSDHLKGIFHLPLADIHMPFFSWRQTDIQLMKTLSLKIHQINRKALIKG